ncbi:MAG: hypothetical protein Q9213_002504 [Squamulea squamosa]
MGQACSVIAEHLIPPLPPETTALDLLAAGLGIGLLDYEDNNANQQISGAPASASPSVLTCQDDDTSMDRKKKPFVATPAVALVDRDGEQPSAEAGPLGSSTDLSNQANSQADTEVEQLLKTGVATFEKDRVVEPIDTTTATPPEGAGGQYDIGDAAPTSVAKADTPNVASNGELIDTTTTKLTYHDYGHQDPAEHMPVQHEDTPTTTAPNVSDASNNVNHNLSLTAVTIIFSTPDLSDSAPNNNQIHCPEDVQMEHDTMTAVDPANVNMLLARIAELESVVDEQKHLLDAQAAQTVHNGIDDSCNSYVWANRSTAPVEEVDASAWAAAAYDSIARKAADSAQKAKQQGDTIRQLYARVSERDLTIEEQNGKISQFEKRFKSMSLRGTFSRADAAIKETARSKQLQEELDAEKAGREAVVKKVKEDMAIVKKDAAKALADSNEQSRKELAAMTCKHQSEISDSITAHHKKEKNNVAKIQDLENLVSTIKKNDIDRSKRNRDLIIDRDSANTRYEVVEKRCRKIMQASKEQADRFQCEKQQFDAKIGHTEKQLTAAETTIESLRDELNTSVEKEKLQEDAMQLYQDEADKKDATIFSLNETVGVLKANRAALEQKVATCKESKLQAAMNKDAQIQALHTAKDEKDQENALLKAHTELLKQGNEEDTLRKDARIKRLEDERDSSLKNVLDQIAIINIFQGEVEARDEKLRDLEDQVRALRSQLPANTTATLPSTPSLSPAALPSAGIPSSDNQPLQSTPPAPNGHTQYSGLMASSIPLPPSIPSSPLSNLSPVPFPPSALPSPSAVPHSPISPPAWDMSLIDTDLPPAFDDSYSQELLSEMGFSSRSASDASELAVSSHYEVEAPAQSSSRIMHMEDEAEKQETSQHVNLLTAAATYQRLITWPYNIPTRSITWQEERSGKATSSSPHDGSIKRHTAQPEANGSASTPNLSPPDTTSDEQGPEADNPATEKPSSMQGPGGEQENKDQRQDGSEEAPASPASETVSSSVQTKDDTETSDAHSNTSTSELSDAAPQESAPKPAIPSTDLDLATQACSQGSKVSGEPSGSVDTRTGYVEDKRPDVGHSHELGDGSKAKEQPRVPPLINVAPITNPWSMPADGFFPTLARDSSDGNNTEEVSNDKGDVPMSEAPRGQLSSDTIASNTNPAPTSADDTFPIAVNNSSQYKKEEELDDNGDDPMGEEARGWDTGDDFEMGDGQQPADIWPSNDFDEEMANSAPGQIEPSQEPVPPFSTDFNQTVPPVEDVNMDDQLTQIFNTDQGNAAFTSWAPATASFQAPAIPPQDQSSQGIWDATDLAIATILHEYNQSHPQSTAPINQSFSGSGFASEILGQTCNGFGQNNIMASSRTPAVQFGNHDQTQGLSTPGQFSFGHGIAAPKSVLQNTAAFGQQLHQPSSSSNQWSSPFTMGFDPWSAQQNAIRSEYPDPYGLHLAPPDIFPDSTGAQAPDFFDGQKRPDTVGDSLPVGWMDDYDATFGTPDGATEANKYRADGSLFTPRPKPRCQPRPNGHTPSQAAVQQSEQTVLPPIFGVIPTTPYSTNKQRKAAQKAARRIDSQRPANAHVLFSGYASQSEKTTDGCIDPQLLLMNGHARQLPQSTGSGVLISPASPTESEALSAEYEDEPSRPLATEDDLENYLVEHMDDAESEDGEGGEQEGTYVQDKKSEPDLPEYQESGDAWCGDEQHPWSLPPIPASYQGSPFSPGTTYPKYEKPTPAPASATSSGSSPETHSTHPTTPEQISSESSEDEGPTTQASKNVPPEQRPILPLPHRRRGCF